MGSMTQSLEDYIETVYVLVTGSGAATVRDVARMLDVKMPSVVKAIRELKGLGLVTQEPYSTIELTTKGRRVAKSILGRHTLLRAFLIKLGVGRTAPFAFLGSMAAAFAGALSASAGYAGLIIGAGMAGLVYVFIAVIVKFAGV